METKRQKLMSFDDSESDENENDPTQDSSSKDPLSDQLTVCGEGSKTTASDSETLSKPRCCCHWLTVTPIESPNLDSTPRDRRCNRCESWHKLMATPCTIKPESNSSDGMCYCCNRWQEMASSCATSPYSERNSCCDRWGKAIVPSCPLKSVTILEECKCCKTWLGGMASSCETSMEQSCCLCDNWETTGTCKAVTLSDTTQQCTTQKSVNFDILPRHFLDTGNPSNVKFAFEYFENGKVMEYTVEAHKEVLINKSPVFEAMFTRWDTSKPITITDFSYHVFMEFLRFIYTEDLNLNAQNYVLLMQLSDMYQVKDLFRFCELHLKSYCKANNCISIYLMTSLLNKQEMKNIAWEVLIRNLEAVMLSEEFVLLPNETLVKILKLNDMHYYMPAEKTIEESCSKWARTKCQNLELEANPTNMQNVLGEAFRLIRFTVLGYHCGREDSLLTKEQKTEVLSYLLRPNDIYERSKLSWIENLKPRVGYEFQIRRFRKNLVKKEKSWIYRKRKWDRVGFTVSEDILITGIECYGNSLSYDRYNPSSEKYDVAIQLVKYDKETCVVGSGHQVVNDKGTYFKIKFDKPAYIISGQKYIIACQIKGPRSFFGENGYVKETVDSQNYPVTFNFFEAPHTVHSNSTGVEKGVIPSIYFRLASSSEFDVEFID